MTIDALVRLGLLISIWLIVLSLGARASVQSALFVLRRPAALARAAAAIFVVVPAFAVVLAATAPLAPAIKFAIVAMSVAPVPPILPYKQMKAGGQGDYAVGLLVAASLISMVLTPLLVTLAAHLLRTEAHVAVGQVARPLLLSIGIPLAAGMLLHAASEGAAVSLADVAQKVGFLLLLVLFAVMVGAAARQILGLLGNGAALAIAATVAVGLLAGHLLGGGRDSGALALAAATRHPGVALAIAEMSFPDQRKSITAAILLYLLITAHVSAPYARWMRGRSPQLEETAAPRS
jgi:BASS family bile acid:Na+ symporter